MSFISYTFLLLVEKIVFNTSMIIPLNLNEDSNIRNSNENKNIEKENENDEEEETIKNIISSKGKFASFLQIRNSKIFNKFSYKFFNLIFNFLFKLNTPKIKAR